MTTEATDYAAMTDREIDERIAEEIFRAKVWRRETTDGSEILWMTRHSPHQELPCYTTSAAAWMLLVEEMRKRWKDTSHQWIFEEGDDQWHAIIFGDSPYLGQFHPSLFRATCIAALRWVEANK